MLAALFTAVTQKDGIAVCYTVCFVLKKTVSGGFVRQKDCNTNEAFPGARFAAEFS